MKPRILVVFVLVALSLVLALHFRQGRVQPLVVSGFVEADQVRVGSRVGGRVARVHVEEGARVAAGDVLFELEPYDLHERRAAAAAAVEEARVAVALREAGLRAGEVARARARRDALAARVDELVHGPRPQELAAARARADLASAELDLARQDEVRTENLRQEAVASAEALDRARTARRVAEATLAVRREEQALLEEGTRPEVLAAARADLAAAEAEVSLAEEGFRAEEVEQARAALAAAEAQLAALDRALEELAVRAPVAAGTGERPALVEAVDIDPGDLVAAGAPALSLLDPSELWVRAYVPENRLDVAVGQEVSVSVDSFPGRRFSARVRFVAREAEFTPGNVQTPEERSKQVFRIRVDLLEGHDVLRAGMAADVHLEEGGR